MGIQPKTIKLNDKTLSKKSNRESKINSEPHILNINLPTKHNKLI